MKPGIVVPACGPIYSGDRDKRITTQGFEQHFCSKINHLAAVEPQSKTSSQKRHNILSRHEPEIFSSLLYHLPLLYLIGSSLPSPDPQIVHL